MTLAPGTKLGLYEIQSPLGAGGMGEVYRARDNSLGRDIAIKVLPSYVSNDTDRLRRFEQEAKAAAALNHPNILAVHQLGTYQGAPYLITELLEGSTLREQLMRGPLPIRKALDYGAQIAHGLAAAHERGIVHRDLKPENLFITKDGRAKILDFGLAKLIRTPATRDTTLTAQTGTEPGVVLGTVGYMSPEQVRGSSADHRSDIFAFGAIVYEMLSGKRAFQRPTSAETMSAILNEDPPAISQTTHSLPPALQRVVQRCLEKNPEQRFQSASDLAFALEALSDSGSTSSRAITPQAADVSLKWIIAGALAILVIAGLAAWYFMPSPEPRVRGSTQLTSGTTPLGGMVTDGSRLYFTDNRPSGAVLAQMSINGGEVSIVPTVVKNPLISDISPDHTQLLIGPNQPGDTPIWSQPLPSGSAHPIGDLKLGWAAWSPNGKQLVFAMTGHDLYVANADGSDRRKIASTPDGQPNLAYFSPDGTRIRFQVQSSSSVRLWEVRPDGTALHPLLPGWNTSSVQCCGRWTPDGRYYFFTNVSNVNTENTSADIYVLREAKGWFHRTSILPTRLTFGPIQFFASSMSVDEKKIFVFGQVPRAELVHYDKSTKDFVPYLGGIPAEHMSFSPDRKWIAYVSIRDSQLWRSRVDGSERLQLTFAPGYSELPRWSPNGKSIAFTFTQVGSPPKTYVVAAEGGSPKLLVPDGGDASWSLDGNRLAFGTGAPGAEKGSTIGIVNVKTGELSTVPDSNGMFSPRWSPDGRYLIAVSLDQKKLLLYEFKSQAWRTWMINDENIDYPAWTPDSRYVQFASGGSDDPGIFRVKMGDSKPQKLLSLKNLRSYSGVIGTWSSIAPDDSVMLVRDTDSTEIYALDVDFP